MKSIIKKLAATALCGVLALTSVVMANAASDEMSSTADSANDKVKIIKTYGLGEDKLAVAAYNFDPNNKVQIKLENSDEKTYKVDVSTLGNKIKTVSLPADRKYEYAVLLPNGGYRYNAYRDDTAGIYLRVRVKLHDIDPELFTEKGTSFKEDVDGSIREFNYRYQYLDCGDYCGEYNSTIVVQSGGFITLCAPDENGYVEFYVSSKVNASSVIYTSYSCENTGSKLMGDGLGDMGQFILGDADNSSETDVRDATTVQKYVVNIESLDSFAKFKADVNRDGDINVIDATLIQKYVVGLYK